MRFYGQSYSEVMRLPLRTFWSLNANVVRLRAEEAIPMIELFLLGGNGATSEAITAIRKHLQEQMGTPAQTKVSVSNDEETTRAGIQKLRELKSKMVN